MASIYFHNYPKIIQHQSISSFSGPERLFLAEDYIWDSGTRGINWIPDHIGFRIIDGYWHMDKGWSWDGATVAPEGPKDPNKDGYPIIWLATLVHDLGIYFLKDKSFPYTKQQIDTFFLIIMLQVGFKWSFVYFLGVRIFGGIYGFFAKIWRKITNSKPRHDPIFLG